MARVWLVIAAMALGTAGCSNQGLRDLRSNSGGPDEFRVLPAKPLNAPASYSDLPTPTPGQRNLTDAQPNADAVVALGGRSSAMVVGGIPTSDAALVAQARRNGTPVDIRETLAEEDAAYRKRRARFTGIRIFRTDRYGDVYRPQTLDPFAEAQRYRRAGAVTPSAPPNAD